MEPIQVNLVIDKIQPFGNWIIYATNGVRHVLMMSMDTMRHTTLAKMIMDQFSSIVNVSITKYVYSNVKCSNAVYFAMILFQILQVRLDELILEDITSVDGMNINSIKYFEITKLFFFNGKYIQYQ